MSKTSVAQGPREGQEGEFPGNGGASLSLFKGGVPKGIAEVDQRKRSGAPPPAPRAEAEALGLDTYKTSGEFLSVLAAESRLKRVRHATITSARLLEEEVNERRRGGFRWEAYMVGCTYRPGEGWSARDLTETMTQIRAYLKARGLPFLYCWVAEIQEKRAAARPGDLEQGTVLHYHVLIWLPRGMSLPKPDKRAWWRHGSTSVIRARRPVGYMVKYASKGGCLDYVPSGARMTGFGGLTQLKRRERAWWMCPTWIREKWSEADRPCRAPGGGWVSRKTGEWIESPWVFLGVQYVSGEAVVMLMKREGGKDEAERG
jgi:hypothetical protein